MLGSPVSSPTKVQDILSKFEHRPTSVVNERGRSTAGNPTKNGVSIQTWTLRRRSAQDGVKGQGRLKQLGVSGENCPRLGPDPGGRGTPDHERPVNVSEIARRFQDKISDGAGGCGPCRTRTPDLVPQRSPPKVSSRAGLPLGPPPQKPVRTFAHDIYVSNKLLAPGGPNSRGGSGSNDKLGRTQSTLPKKPNLPPKPVRSKTVHTISPPKKPSGAAPKIPKGLRADPGVPKGPLKEPGLTKGSLPPQPYATAVIDAVEANSVFRTSPFVDFKSTVNYRFRNQGFLRRSRSVEHIYDEPWDAKPLRLPMLSHYGRLDRLKSPSLGMDLQPPDVVLVDNVLYKRGEDELPPDRANGTQILNSTRELHYMSSPIMGHGSNSKMKTMGTLHIYLNEGYNDEHQDVDHPLKVGTKKVNFLDCNDISDLSFSTIYNSAPRRKKKNSVQSKDDDSGDSDNDISEKEIQERIKHIRKSMNRGQTFHNRASGKLLSYRRQFDLVITVGLKYRDGTTIYQPYIKDVFPGMDSLKADPNDVAHFCFPDAEKWHPSAQRETYTFALTDEKGFRLFGYCRRVKPEGVELNIPVVYCVISPILARAYYFQVLGEIEKRHGLSDVKMKAFLHAVQARSVPQPGKTVTIKCSGMDGEQQVTFSRSNDFSMDNGDTYRLLKHLSASVLLKVFASVLLERRVIFCASQPEVITECIHALISLLYPFIWQHTLIPILPDKMVDVVGSPTPYIVGILNTVVPQLDDVSLEEGILVDLDSSQLIRDVGDETTIIPKAIQRALSTALKLIKSRPDVLESPKSILVSQAFMQMFLELVGHYPQHMSLYDDGQRIFHRESFCTALPSHSIQMFLKWFTETQMFDRFIEDRTSKNMDSEFFEQCIRDRQADGDLLKPSRRYNVRDFSKKMRNIGERLIGMGNKAPVKV